MQGWDEVTQFKDVLIQLGDTTTKIEIVTETCEVTVPEWNAVLAYAAEHFRQPLWQASFVLQAMNPIPADYATDLAYWPTAEYGNVFRTDAAQIKQGTGESVGV